MCVLHRRTSRLIAQLLYCKSQSENRSATESRNLRFRSDPAGDRACINSRIIIDNARIVGVASENFGAAVTPCQVESRGYYIDAADYRGPSRRLLSTYYEPPSFSVCQIFNRVSTRNIKWCDR